MNVLVFIFVYSPFFSYWLLFAALFKITASSLFGHAISPLNQEHNMSQYATSGEIRKR